MRPKKRKSNRKPKLNITLRKDTKQKLAALAELEKRSVSNLIEIMADERWEGLADYLQVAKFNGEWKIINVLEELKPKPSAQNRLCLRKNGERTVGN
jgi:predicted CopG family antitoxin